MNDTGQGISLFGLIHASVVHFKGKNLLCGGVLTYYSIVMHTICPHKLMHYHWRFSFVVVLLFFPQCCFFLLFLGNPEFGACTGSKCNREWAGWGAVIIDFPPLKALTCCCFLSGIR